MIFILLINVKMSTFVGILTFISRINTETESLKQESSFLHCLKFLGAVEISCLVELSTECYITSGIGLFHFQRENAYTTLFLGRVS